MYTWKLQQTNCVVAESQSGAWVARMQGSWTKGCLTVVGSNMTSSALSWSMCCG